MPPQTLQAVLFRWINYVFSLVVNKGCCLGPYLRPAAKSFMNVGGRQFIHGMHQVPKQQIQWQSCQFLKCPWLRRRDRAPCIYHLFVGAILSGQLPWAAQT